MAKFERSVVHDVAEVAGLPAFSFGDEAEETRHVVVWKAEDAPSDAELDWLRRGEKEPWDPKVYAERESLKRQQELEDRARDEDRRKAEKAGFVPNKANYRDKYEHLIGKESALEAARKTEIDPNKTYGLGVTAEMKRDRRTVEDIQAEIRAKKRQKLQEGDQ